MRVGIYNLHNMCENNTFFLSRASRYFKLNGHSVSYEISDADLIFIGGCAVTDVMRRRCEESILSRMQELGDAHFVVFGCLAAFPEGLQPAVGADGERLHIIGYNESHRLDELIRARIPYQAVSVNRLEGHVPYQPRVGPDDAYVLIAQGCGNDCSYCNIKKVKGNVLSRPEETIEGEVRELYGCGVRIVTLLADDCGSYGMDRNSDLPALLTRLCGVAPDLRCKLYTVFPSLFLKQATRLEPFFAKRRIPYICLPVQSAATRVLGLMNRRYDPEDLAAAISRVRSLDPGMFIYTHFIFNFPTETWDEFEQSVAFARHFDSCVFIGYGENGGTRASTYFPKCSAEILQAKAHRLKELVKLGKLPAFVVPTP